MAPCDHHRGGDVRAVPDHLHHRCRPQPGRIPVVGVPAQQDGYLRLELPGDPADGEFRELQRHLQRPSSALRDLVRQLADRGAGGCDLLNVDVGIRSLRIQPTALQGTSSGPTVAGPAADVPADPGDHGDLHPDDEDLGGLPAVRQRDGDRADTDLSGRLPGRQHLPDQGLLRHGPDSSAWCCAFRRRSWSWCSS